jgi:hypothetical protein
LAAKQPAPPNNTENKSNEMAESTILFLNTKLIPSFKRMPIDSICLAVGSNNKTMLLIQNKAVIMAKHIKIKV